MARSKSGKAVLSVNFAFDKKMTADMDLRQWWKFNCSFENTKLDVIGLDDAVQHGHSICAQHAHRHQWVPGKDGKLKKTGFRHHLNWMPTSIAVLDFDDGTIDPEGIMEDPRVAIFHIYTTSSHTSEHPRFRLVASMERPIMKLENHRALLAAMADLYRAADRSSKNPVHAYAGNNNDNYVSYTPGATMSVDEARRIITEYRALVEEEVRQRQERLARYGSEMPEAEEVAEMLRYIPDRQSYMDWLKTLTAVKAAVGPDVATELCEQWSPGFPGEVAMKMRSLDPGRVGIGWLVTVAKSHGYTPQKKFNTLDFVHRAVRRL